jgi:hypothetical protein
VKNWIFPFALNQSKKTFISLVVLSFVGLPCSYGQASPGVLADANHPAGAPGPLAEKQVWKVDPLTGALSISIPMFDFLSVPGRGAPHSIGTVV